MRFGAEDGTIRQKRKRAEVGALCTEELDKFIPADNPKNFFRPFRSDATSVRIDMSGKL